MGWWVGEERGGVTSSSHRQEMLSISPPVAPPTGNPPNNGGNQFPGGHCRENLDATGLVIASSGKIPGPQF